MKAMVDNGTWRVVPPKAGIKAIKCHWVYAKKMDSAGNVKRYKARLVANGYLQREGIDFFQTYSPVVKFTTLRTVVAFAAVRKYSLLQADAVDAYLQSYLPENERVRMIQPPGHPVGPPHHELEMVRAIFGLKQSGFHWNELCDRQLKAIGWQASPHDPCLYTKMVKGDVVVLCVYVDDFLLAAPTDDIADKLLNEMETKISLKRQGNAEFLLGVKISRNGNRITLPQTAYISTVLDCNTETNKMRLNCTASQTQVGLRNRIDDQCLAKFGLWEVLRCLGDRPDNERSRRRHAKQSTLRWQWQPRSVFSCAAF
ncbi:hypothetical protein AeMF1_000457 [Aphanomyces euteiches]|nr:hypothetical protein AeMF1_019900 [Aphanomyces euteiches]KAH9117240.1 hypothetical protein AeMF1_008963 [Aphanomyces euteiches]KAH9120174.1 hypothetical protein AeMF1_007523 [Aphanomyces euteiches]KAH9129530.1 hypothetical protein AeMF1_000457 [Aphanomyces euteiches]